METYAGLKARGFIAQVVDEAALEKLLNGKGVTFYAGFDPTADSLHVGHLLPLMAMARLQRAGHIPIALLGGGTALVADPTGKDEMRPILTRETIAKNTEGIRRQMSRLLDFSPGKGLLLNNDDWLSPINYVDFLRDVGVHFTVNRMLTAECFKQRWDKGLTFIEFNYMLLQAYDFFHLHSKHSCTLQIGGDDQWSNILAGADLIRRKTGEQAFCFTLPLITLSSGKKMGKTEKGAVWLDPKKTSPYEYYQFWRNTHDDDVKRFLHFFTFLQVHDVEELGSRKDQAINDAKKELAFKATEIVHGTEEAEKAKIASESLFLSSSGGWISSKHREHLDKSPFDPPESVIPTTTLQLTPHTTAVDLLISSGIVSSKSEGKRLIQGGGIKIKGGVVSSPQLLIDNSFVNDKGVIVIQKGKKTYHHIRIF